MTNYINYYSHKAATPSYYQRNFARDLPKDEKEDPEWMALGKRATQIALPFVSLYRPLGSAISLTMGTARCLTHISGTIEAQKDGDAKKAAQQMVQLCLAVMALAGSYFNFTLGLFLTTGQECILSAANTLQHLQEGEFDKAGEHLLQGVSNAFYLAIMFTGSLEITCASMVVQALLSFYQARQEFAQERYAEAGAKIVMGMIRCNQAKSTYDVIQRKNYLLAMNKQLAQLFERAKNGKEVEHLIDNPLNDLDGKIKEKQVILTDDKNKEFDFGSHFHGFGKETVKGANLSFRTTVVNGKNVTELDFKVNHVFRDRLGKLIGELQSFKKDDLQVLLTAANSHATGIKVTSVPYQVSKTLNLGSAYKVDFEGLGSLYVGGSTTKPNLFDRVIVRMDEGRNIYELHEMLSFMKLDDAVRVSSQEDILRLKIGHLFRTFCPREATPFERTEAFFTMPVGKLQEEIVKKAPAMKGIFDDYLSKMQAREILPGRVRYGITGLADKAHELGARALTAAVTGAYTDGELFHRIGSMLKMGMISSEMRYTNGLAVSGMSVSADFNTGGADSVFTQMLTEKNCKDHMPFNALNYNSKVRMLISLDALETGTYQYPFDGFGSRTPYYFGDIYKNRPGIQEFVNGANVYLNPGHEVMVKERIPPSLFKGLIVSDAATRNNLLDYLRKCQIVQKDNGIEKILGIDINQFIRVGTHVSEAILK